MQPLVEIKDLKVYFHTQEGLGFWRKNFEIRAVNSVDLTIEQGETLGLVGESGCGKTTLGRALLYLVPKTAGNILFNGIDLDTLGSKGLLKARKDFQIIFQNPDGALNPRMTVGRFLSEPLEQFTTLNKKERGERIRELLGLVGLDPRFSNRYPHEFSGGQQQRIGIARALASGASFLVADEPVSALDVSIQAQILNLLTSLKSKLKLTMLFISHDLTTVRYLSNRVAVMYFGKIVEIATTKSIFESPKHPYTRFLIDAIPQPDPKGEHLMNKRLLEGEPPSPIFEVGVKDNRPACPFYHRCPERMDRCLSEKPDLLGDEVHRVACHLNDPKN